MGRHSTVGPDAHPDAGSPGGGGKRFDGRPGPHRPEPSSNDNLFRPHPRAGANPIDPAPQPRHPAPGPGLEQPGAARPDLFGPGPAQPNLFDPGPARPAAFDPRTALPAPRRPLPAPTSRPVNSPAGDGPGYGGYPVGEGPVPADGEPSAGRPAGEGHSPFSRRNVLGILGVASTAAACTGVVTVVTGRPSGAPHRPSGPLAPTAGEAASATGIGLVGTAGGAAGTAGVGAGTRTAPVSGQLAAESANAKVWQPVKAPRPSPASTVRQPPTILTLDPVLHLARRATYGPTPGLVADIRRLGPTAWLEQQLTPQQIADPEVDSLLAPYQYLTMSPGALKALFDANKNAPDNQRLDYFGTHDQLAESVIIRSLWSRRQLHVAVSNFFSDVLHVPIYTDKTRHTAADFDRNVIQKYALGRFSDMLWASTTHPAMLVYLDQASSRKDNVNQNLGRELLELHTIGAAEVFTGAPNYQPRTDVVASAMVLTGLTVDDATQSFRFDPSNHYVGPVKVMGWSAANANPAQGLATIRGYVNYLANHPETALHLATRLARRFVADAPPAALVRRLARTYLASGTAIVPVLRALFGSAEFAASVGQKYRDPQQALAASLRTIGIGPDPNGTGARYAKQGTLAGIRDLRYQLDQLGHVPRGHAAPDGYPDYADAWLSGMGTLGRWNINTSLAQGWWKSLAYPKLATLYGGHPATYGDAVDALAKRLLFQPITAAHRAALVGFLGKPAATPVGADPTLGGLLTPLVALILDAPYHQLR